MRLAVEREPAAVEEVFAFDGSVVGKTELPQRHLVGAFLAVLRINVHEDEDAIVLLAGQPRIGQDLVVRGVEEDGVAEVPERRVRAPDAVELADVLLDVAGCVPVALPKPPAPTARTLR